MSLEDLVEIGDAEKARQAKLERRIVKLRQTRKLGPARIAGQVGVLLMQLGQALAQGSRYAVGELTHEQMMDELEHWDYTFGGIPEDDPAADAYVRGSWDQIERAGDLLSDDDYQRLFEVTAVQRAASRH